MGGNFEKYKTTNAKLGSTVHTIYMRGERTTALAPAPTSGRGKKKKTPSIVAHIASREFANTSTKGV